MIGIIGGSGFYSLLDNITEKDVDTPFGKPSAPISIGEHNGEKVAFLPRHGKNHEYPPHKVPYLANLWALKEAGVKKIFGPCASGSLKPEFRPGDFVICDQFVDRTCGRSDTFYNGIQSMRDESINISDKTAHVSSADPYCPALRKLALKAANELDITAHDGGTVVVIQGPRFSTRAESRWFSEAGFGVINMTQYPECILARELELCYCNISLITDYDAGLEEKVFSPAKAELNSLVNKNSIGAGASRPSYRAVTNEMVIKTFKENNEKVKKLLLKMIEKISTVDKCDCHRAMEHAFM